jgi:hypothetical protein
MDSDLINDGGGLVISLCAVATLTVVGTLHRLGRELSEFLESDAWLDPQPVPARTHAGSRLTPVKRLHQ